MKKIFLIFLGIYFLLGLKAQEEAEIKTLFGEGQIKISGFGGPFMNFSIIDGKFAHLMGGGGGILINDFFFGGYGIGLTNSIEFKGPSNNEVGFGHGGFWLGYNFLSRKLVHPSLHMQVGWGKISERLPSGGPLDKGDNIFVIIPTLELEMNITKYFKISTGGNYRFVSFVDDENYSESDFISPGVFLAFKFGLF